MEKKAEDCYFFLNGYCSKGSSCEFRHAEGIQDRPICVAWLLEKCADPNCPNRHPTVPRQKDGSRTVCFYNQSCTRPDCPFFHQGTIASPATPRSDQETPLVADLATPRDGSKAAPAPATVPTSAAVPPAGPARLAGPIRPRKKGAVLTDLSPRWQQQEGSAAGRQQDAGPKQGFVKSLDEILKEKEDQEKGVKAPQVAKPKAVEAKQAPAPAPQAAKERSGRPQLPQMSAQRSTNNGPEQQRQADGRNRRSAGAPPQKNSQSTTTTSRPSFGVKSLDELLTEREGGAPAAGEQKQATASAAGAKGRSTASTATSPAGVKRAREESVATAKALPQPQQKQQKAEPVAAPPKQQQTTQAEEEDDFEKELEEIGIEDIDGTDDTNFDDDDDLSELLAE